MKVITMSLVEQLSACVKIVFRNGTTIYLYQYGHTSHMQWVMECFHAHLKDACGTDKCVFPLAMAMNQWNHSPGLVSITAEPTAADLRLTFDFQNASVSGTFGKKEFTMEMLEWTGTPLDDLPFVDPWGEIEDMDETVDFDTACAALNEEVE